MEDARGIFHAHWHELKRVRLAVVAGQQQRSNHRPSFKASAQAAAQANHVVALLDCNDIPPCPR